jgi:hypothetical protein
MRLHRGSFLLLLLTVSCYASPSPPPIILLTETGECGSAECASACLASGSDCSANGSACSASGSDCASCELGSQLSGRAVSWLVARLRQLSLTAAKIGIPESVTSVPPMLGTK